LTVMTNGIRAFLTGSLVDVRPVKDTTPYENKEFEFKVIKLDRKRNNVVVSRRAVLEASMGEERQKLLENLQEGTVIKGIVKNITDYGAFVDLGGIDGLLHITDLAWRRVRHPSEVLNVGDEVTAKVLKFDQEKNRVSLGMKQLGEDPWVGIARRYPQGTRLFGKVTNLTDYGSFVEIEQGIEGLVHVSEMDWTNKNIHPSKVVQLGDEVEVMILEIDEDRRRISLGMKQCMANPWDDFAINHKKGDKVKGAIKSITDFGIFIGLPGGIDGLVHLSDLSWSATGEEAKQNFKKGDEVEAVVLSIDVEKERISLGIKQIDGDPFTSYVATHDKNSLVAGTVTSVDQRGAVVNLGDDVEGYLRVSEFSRERIEDLTQHLKAGDKIDALIINVDRKTRSINLSIKAKDQVEQSQAMQKLAADSSSASSGTTNLGALLKAKLNQQ
ncbi:MAG: 30S ribosomal protein S1, partial [Sulfuritalea sp.]|nr:30S ribosomal protein S1 [Sulfuritalea sp.]